VPIVIGGVELSGTWRASANASRVCHRPVATIADTLSLTRRAGFRPWRAVSPQFAAIFTAHATME
jgi:hypothetical protein